MEKIPLKAKMRRSQRPIILPKLNKDTTKLFISEDTDEDVITAPVPVKVEVDLDLDDGVTATTGDLEGADGIPQGGDEMSSESQSQQINQYCGFNTATGKYQCKICQADFISRQIFHRHYKAVHQKLRYKCQVCDREFSFPSSLTRHHKNLHLCIKFRCRTCGETSSQRQIIVAHQRNSQGACPYGRDGIHEERSGDLEETDETTQSNNKGSTERWDCEISMSDIIKQEVNETEPVTQAGSVKLEVHHVIDPNLDEDDTTNHREEASILPHYENKCDICHLQVNDLSTHLCSARANPDVRQEVNEVTMKDSRYVYVPRPSSYAQNQLFGRYCSVNPATGKNQCKICRKEFACRDNLAKHYKNLHQKLPAKCPICGKEFINPVSLTHHHKTFHLGRKFRCRTCAKTATMRVDIATHQRHSHGACPAGKGEIEEVRPTKSKNGAPTTNRIQSHPHPESGVRSGMRYRCNFCDANFSQKIGLLFHQSKDCRVKKSSTPSASPEVGNGLSKIIVKTETE